MKLVIGNKAYSSWSLRPWIAMKQLGIAFEELLIPLQQPGTKAEILKQTPNGLVPALIEGELVVFETIAILEYLNERHAHGALWPSDVAARAHARSVAAEMHGGFAAFRRDCPFNIRRAVKKHIPSAEGMKAAERIDDIWQDCRERFGQSKDGGGGPFLFGAFSAADAMYAPVVNRFHVYDVPRSAAAQAYMDAVMALPAWQEWAAAAKAEPWVITSSEVP
jgi:glutathione S-transferase